MDCFNDPRIKIVRIVRSDLMKVVRIIYQFMVHAWNPSDIMKVVWIIYQFMVHGMFV